MYSTLLTLHSVMRWLVLASLLLAIFRGYRGWLLKKSYNLSDKRIRTIASTTAHIQLIVGLALYFVSPIVDYFLHHLKEGMHMREIRFFGMEHVTMMLTGIVIITIGAMKTKRKALDQGKFKTQAIWFTIGLLIILSSIPWAFSPLISRPWLRW